MRHDTQWWRNLRQLEVQCLTSTHTPITLEDLFQRIKARLETEAVRESFLREHGYWPKPKEDEQPTEAESGNLGNSVDDQITREGQQDKEAIARITSESPYESLEIGLLYHLSTGNEDEPWIRIERRPS